MCNILNCVQFLKYASNDGLGCKTEYIITLTQGRMNKENNLCFFKLNKRKKDLDHEI